MHSQVGRRRDVMEMSHFGDSGKSFVNRPDLRLPKRNFHLPASPDSMSLQPSTQCCGRDKKNPAVARRVSQIDG